MKLTTVAAIASQAAALDSGEAFYVSNDRLTHRESKAFCAEDGFLAEGWEARVGNVLISETLWLNDCRIQADGEIKQANCNEKHFALCKNNQTQAAGVNVNVAAGDDVRYTAEQARAIYAENEDFLGDLPLGPDQIELIEPKRSPRAARTHSLWSTTNENGNLRVAIRYQDRSFSKIEQGVINDALTSITSYVEGCIEFVDDTASRKHEPYILVRRYDSNNRYDSGCWSYVGNISPYSQSLNLGYGCMNKRIIQHEFLHALGFFHEHTRPDRDNYITVNQENIKDANAHNYYKMTDRGYVFNDMSVPYDWNSVMHYKSTYFITAEAYTANPRQYTMTMHDGTPLFPNSPRMTSLDSKQLALQYPQQCSALKMDKCDNGEEILLNRKCDSVLDCSDGSDEADCGDYNCPRTIKLSSSSSAASALMGVYDKKRGLHNGRAYWKKRGRTMFLYYSHIRQQWLINRDVNDQYAHMESLNGDIPCPTYPASWAFYDGATRQHIIMEKFTAECYGPLCDRVGNCNKHDCDENAFCEVNSFVNEGYTCTCLDGYEGDGKTCRLPCTAQGGLENDHHKIIVSDEDSIDFDYASYQCQQLGDGWDLSFVNFRHEYYYLLDLIEANCLQDYGFWFGWQKETNNKYNTIFGKEAQWNIKWDRKNPTKAQRNNECVQLSDGKFTRVACDSYSSAFVCEKHNYADTCSPSNREPQPDPKYVINKTAGKSWEASRQACQKKGDGWDLAVIDNQQELDHLVTLTNCADNAFWLGQIDQEGVLVDVHGEPVTFTPWDMHTNVLNPGSNDQIGVENCIRLRGNVINDALCTLQHTGAAKFNIPMGYICEYTEPECTVKPNANLNVHGYKIIEPDQAETVDFEGAREECKKFGNEWDLVVFNNPIEFDAIQAVLERNCIHDMAYWVGYTEDDFDVTSVRDNRDVRDNLLNWFGSLNWDISKENNPEPNDTLGKEECVRMKNGVFNDAMCHLKHQGAKRKGIGMGFICEKHARRESTQSLIVSNAFCSMLEENEDLARGAKNKICRHYHQFIATAIRDRKPERTCASNGEFNENHFKTRNRQKLLEFTGELMQSKLSGANCKKIEDVNEWKGKAARKLRSFFDKL